MKYLWALVLLISITSCQNENDGYSITGDVKSVEDGQLMYLSQLDQNNQPTRIDSVSITNEKFSLDLPKVTSPNLNFLTLEGMGGNVMFISENEPIHFEIYKDSLPASKVSGGKENEEFNDYLNYLKGLNERVTVIRSKLRQEMSVGRDSATIVGLQMEEDELRTSDIEYKKNKIQENPDVFTSILMLSDMHSLGAPSAEVLEYYEMLSDRIKDTQIAKTVKGELDKRSATDIGSKAPHFSGPNPQGEQLALKDLMGTVTLIDFWAAWCRPCRVENPNIVNVYNKYHDQGFNVIGISLDREGDRDKWLKAIEDDKLTWPQISSLKFWQDPIAELYGIRAIPAAFLLDANGVIVAKNLRGQELENKVKELLEK